MKLTTMIIAAVMAATTATAEPYAVKHTSGGNLLRFEKRYNKMQSRPVEIRGKGCASSCTLWLSHPDVCIEPETLFGFHGPSDGLSSLISAQLTIIPLYHFMPLKARKKIVNAMAAHYRLNGNEAIGDWFMDSGAWKLYGVFFKTLTGQQVHDKFGTPFCEPLPAVYVDQGPTR